MSIVCPTPGELLDRLSILALKISTSRLRGQPHEHYCAEQDAVVEMLSSYTMAATFLPKAMELARVNKDLWDTEEKRRGWVAKLHANVAPINQTVAGQWQAAVAEEAVAILEDLGTLNTLRVQLKEEIDKSAGQWKGAEKVV